MADLNVVKRILQDTSELSRLGQNLRALAVLDESIADAIKRNDGLCVRLLARHAAAITEHTGNAGVAREYLETSIQHSFDDPSVWYKVAEVLENAGEQRLARQYAIRSYEISMANPEKHTDVVESLKRRWPDIDIHGT